MIRRAPPDVVFVVRGASYASAEEASIESWARRGRALRENQAKAKRSLRVRGRFLRELWTKSKRRPSGRFRVRGTRPGSSSCR